MGLSDESGYWVVFTLETKDFCLANCMFRGRLEKIGSLSVKNMFNLTEYTSGYDLQRAVKRN